MLKNSLCARFHHGWKHRAKGGVPLRSATQGRHVGLDRMCLLMEVRKDAPGGICPASGKLLSLHL